MRRSSVCTSVKKSSCLNPAYFFKRLAVHSQLQQPCPLLDSRAQQKIITVSSSISTTMNIILQFQRNNDYLNINQN